MWRCCLKAAEFPLCFLAVSLEVLLLSEMEKSCLAARFACNLSDRGRSEILEIALVEHTTVPRQCKLLEDTDDSRFSMDRPHWTM